MFLELHLAPVIILSKSIHHRLCSYYVMLIASWLSLFIIFLLLLLPIKLGQLFGSNRSLCTESWQRQSLTLIRWRCTVCSNLQTCTLSLLIVSLTLYCVYVCIILKPIIITTTTRALAIARIQWLDVFSEQLMEPRVLWNWIDGADELQQDTKIFTFDISTTHTFDHWL